MHYSFNAYTYNVVKITYDPAKRKKALDERGLDFEDARHVLAGDTFEYEDTRMDYGENRMICFGFLDNRLVALVYVRRGEDTHIVSMRKANDREHKKLSIEK